MNETIKAASDQNEAEKKTPNRKRPIQVKIRMTEEEAAAFQQKLLQSGMTAQEYLLRCALEKNINIIDMEQIKELTVELKREGNNLNQIAKNLNEGGMVSADHIEETKEELKKTWQLLRQFLAKLA